MKLHGNQWKVVCLAGLILLLALTACGPSVTAETQPAIGSTEAPASAPPPQVSSQAAGEAVINASDPCGLFTKEQVGAAFGKTVMEAASRQANIGQECEFKFEAKDTQLSVTFYEGAEAKNYFATLITAGKQSCDELLNAMFDVAFAPLTQKYPSADSSLLQLPLGDLYRQYLGVLGECMYVHTEGRADAGENVVETETIFLNWASNVAVLQNDRVVEFTYQEPIPPGAAEAMKAGTDKEKFYAIADPYRQQVLSGYTESLIQMVKTAAAK